MTARECLGQATAAGFGYQRVINAFIDDFRRAPEHEREHLIAEPIVCCGRIEGLIAAVVSALCRETGTATPEWVADVGSSEPFFAFPGDSYELRVRLMFESPAPFRIRNVFVPENYLERA